MSGNDAPQEPDMEELAATRGEDGPSIPSSPSETTVHIGGGEPLSLTRSSGVLFPPLPRRTRRPLLPVTRREERPSARHDDGYSTPCFKMFGFVFLTLNSGMAVYGSNGDPWSVCFVVSSYVGLILLFVCLRMYEKSSQEVDSPRREYIVKVAAWILTTLLMVMLSYKVATVMPLAMAAVAWVIAATILVGLFFAFFEPAPRARRVPAYH